MSIIRYAVLNDIHFPYEHKRKYAKALSIIGKWDNLSGIYLNGDILEIESLSRHPKGPQAIKSFEYEIDYANSKFDEICETFKDVPVTLVEGNHCYRLFRYIRDIAPEMWGLIDNPQLLKFPDRGWKFVPYGPSQYVQCGKTRLYVRHEPLAGGVNCAKATAEKSWVDTLFGHTHVEQRYTVRLQGPTQKLIRAYSGGWLGDKTRPCFDYRGPRDNWVEGFSEITCDDKDKSGDYEYRFIYL